MFMEFKRLGDYVKIRTGKLDANAASEKGQYPFFTCSIEPLRIDTYSYDCECALVAGNGDLNVKYYNGKFDAYQRTYIIESNDKTVLSVPYLYCFLNKYVETLRKQAIGGVIKYIKLGNLTEAQIPLFSLEEQEKIVEIIGMVNQVIENRKQQLQQLDELVKARFVELFGTEAELDRWSCCTIGDVADVCVGVVIKPTQYYTDKGVPAFRSLNIGEMHVMDADWVYFTEEGHQKNQKSVIRKNDVLVVRSGAPGTACVATEKYEGFNAVDIIIAHPDNSKVNSVFLAAYTNMPHGMTQIREKTGGAAQQHFNVGGYKAMRLIMPPMELQEQFATFVEQTDKSKLAIQQSLDKLETIKKALMQQYFG